MVLRGAAPQPPPEEEEGPASPPQPGQLWGRRPVVDHLLCMSVHVLWQRDIMHPPGQTTLGVHGEGFAEDFREGRMGTWGAPSAAPTNPVL